MITIDKVMGSLIEIRIPECLHPGDFKLLAPRVDELMASHGHVRLLLDARLFKGWENLEIAEEHFQFVKAHQQKVEKVAIMAAHPWQHWLGAIANTFMHPEIRVFDDEAEARAWINS